MKQTLIFVYNADSGVFNLLTDIAHKFFSPDTYACNLCAITHSLTGMHDQWKTFIDGLSLSVEFYHRDEFIREFQLAEEDFPAVFLKEPGILRVLITAAEINTCSDIRGLQALISDSISAEHSHSQA